MNRTFYYVKSIDEDYIFDNVPKSLKKYIFEEINPREKIIINLSNKPTEARIGKLENNDFKLFILTFEKRYVKRLKFFKELMESTLMILKPMVEFKNNLKIKNDNIIEEFIHNAISINSYSIQDLFSLIPQDTLTGNYTEQNEVVKKIIKEKPNITADTLLKQIKYSLATKVEYSVFQRLIKSSVSLQKEKYIIREVILSVLQIFNKEFDENKIEIYLGESYKELELDYDSIFVSFYYIFENATKYCCPNTKIKIYFNNENNSFDIVLKMISLPIKNDEIEKIVERGYRSDIARNLINEGLGIGMYRIVKTLKLNNAQLEIIPNSFEAQRIHKNICFEGNEFRIKFKNQNSWHE